MTQLPALPPVPESHLPVPIEPGLGNALASLSNAMAGGRELPADRALSPVLRERLCIRADVLAGWLAPCRPDEPDRPGEARVMIAALLAVLPVQGSKGNADDAGRIQALYLRVLAGLPRFALRAACATAMTRGLGGNRKFAPSPADLRAEAELEAHRWRVEADKVRRVLEAKLAAPRPSEDVRKASAAAARRSFGIPAGGFSGDKPHRVDADAPDALAKIAAGITARSNARMAAYRRSVRDAEHGPDDRFAGEDAA